MVICAKLQKKVYKKYLNVCKATNYNAKKKKKVSGSFCVNYVIKRFCDVEYELKRPVKKGVLSYTAENFSLLFNDGTATS